MKASLKFTGLSISLSIIYFLHSCLQPYAPPEITQAESFLVVEGSLNVAPSAISEIKLSRTQKVNDKDAPNAEQRAVVRVEGDKGSQFNFTETQPGTYRRGAVSYATNEKFRLHVKTSNGKEYRSSYVPAMQTPPVDSVTYRLNSDSTEVQINVNTHDPLNKTHFYRWNFEETWEYRMPLYSAYEVIGGKVKARTQDVNTCWGTQKSARITVATSVRLSSDVIRDLPIAYVPASSGKLDIKYSLLVRQYGLSREEFDYWTALSKTNEVTGGLFDSPPSQVTGNISCLTHPDEIVFGFFSASTLQQKRLFINEGLRRRTIQDQLCEPLDTLAEPEAIRRMGTESFLLLIEHPVPGSIVTWYTTGSVACSDCRILGGSTQKPDFWK